MKEGRQKMIYAKVAERRVLEVVTDTRINSISNGPDIRSIVSNP